MIAVESVLSRPYDCRYSYVMRPLRYSINVTLDGCCDHRAIPTDEDLHRYWAEKLAQADALLFGRVTYEMMETAWRVIPQASVRYAVRTRLGPLGDVLWKFCREPFFLH